jgi:hypothetical protein
MNCPYNRISGALHLGIFDQPGNTRVSTGIPHGIAFPEKIISDGGLEKMRNVPPLHGWSIPFKDTNKET